MTEQELKLKILQKIIGGVRNANPAKIMTAVAPKVIYAAARGSADYANNKKAVPRPTVSAPGANLPLPTPANIAKGVAEAGQAGIKSFVEGTANTAGAVVDAADWINSPGKMFLPADVRNEMSKQSAGQLIRSAGQNLSSMVSRGQQLMNQGGIRGYELNPQSASSTVGGVLGNLASQVPSMMLGGNLTDKIQGLNIFKSGLMNKLAGNVAGGVVGTEGMTAANEGRFANPQELMVGGAIDAGMTLLSGGLNKLSKNAYDRILALTPKQQASMAERGLDLAGEMSKRGYVSTSKKGLAQKIGKDVGDLSEKLDDLIRKADSGNDYAIAKLGERVGVSSDDLIAGVREKVLNDKRLRPKFGEIKTVEKQIDNALDEFKNVVGSRTLTYEQVQSFKKQLGNSLTDLLAKSGDAKGTARELVNDVLRDNAKTIIENNIKGASRLNKQMAPLLEIKNQLKKKGDYSGYLMDGIFAAGGMASGKSPQDTIMDVLPVLAIKRGLQSVGGRALRGSALSNLSKMSQTGMVRQALKNFIPLSFLGK